jgi:hopanoid biosynthesis associated protein HpnK
VDRVQELNKPPRRVIITGDDFGLSPNLNQAIVLAHRQGVLTCASLMVAGPAGEEAVALARDLPDLCLGIHLTLIQGRSVLPPPVIGHLVDSEGNFRTNPVGAGFKYFFSPQIQQEIRQELTAQIEKFLSWGLTPWFVNGHLNIHLHPAIWPLVRQLALDYKIPCIRVAPENLGTTLRLNNKRLVYKAVHAFIFAWLSRRTKLSASPVGLITNDHLFGLLNDGQMDEAYLLGLLPRLAPGVTEIYFHPALASDTALGRWMPAYRHQAELAALLSPRVQAALKKNSLELTDYQQILRRF